MKKAWHLTFHECYNFLSFLQHILKTLINLFYNSQVCNCWYRGKFSLLDDSKKWFKSSDGSYHILNDHTNRLVVKSIFSLTFLEQWILSCGIQYSIQILIKNIRLVQNITLVDRNIGLHYCDSLNMHCLHPALECSSLPHWQQWLKFSKSPSLDSSSIQNLDLPDQWCLKYCQSQI